MTRMLGFITGVFFSTISFAQTDSSNLIKIIQPKTLNNQSKPLIKASSYQLVEIKINRLKQNLNKQSTSGLLIKLPHPDGTFHTYRLEENHTLNPGLSKQFPTIKTYNGYGLNESKEFVKFDITPQGLHAMILAPGKNPIFIDPYLKNNKQIYIVYFQKDFISNKKAHCNVSENNHSFNYLDRVSSFINFSSCTLHTYRLAVAATAEYTEFTGGTVEDALAAQATTINRVNGIYETDIGVQLEIIPQNANIIYTNPNDQPYTSGNPSLLIDENQVNLTAVIGLDNFDIGHVFDANENGSGLASLGSVCVADRKAQGVTGQAAPIGDPFDVDYVAHEMGHQFSANHTFNNSCNGNRNDDTAVEPGSGSTIMGYAGICAPNVQANSDPYFNGISLQEMGTFLTETGSTCGTQQPINAAPIVNQPVNITVPANTPISLVASAEGTNANAFTYGWEQMDNEITIQPPRSTATGGPNFRSRLPTLDSTRYLPDLTSLISNGPFTWEVLSSVSRTMNFRITVRKNELGGSCNAYQDMTVTVNAGAGPFEVINPTTSGIEWFANSLQTVNWSVANTNLPPINATNVDILLSIDGGITYPYTLLENIPNNGSALIRLPNVTTDNARIMIRNSERTFFNISKNNFKLLSPSIILTTAIRNPLNKTQAFIYANVRGESAQSTYQVNGIPNASIVYDQLLQRFVISNILTPRKVPISITFINEDFSSTSNTLTIPGIL